jgi:hypothetical protein
MPNDPLSSFHTIEYLTGFIILCKYKCRVEEYVTCANNAQTKEFTKSLCTNSIEKKEFGNKISQNQ